MKYRLSHLFVQLDPAFPSDTPYHFEIICEPETIEEWQTHKSEKKKTLSAQEAADMGITLPVALEKIALATMAANDSLKATNAALVNRAEVAEGALDLVAKENADLRAQLDFTRKTANDLKTAVDTQAMRLQKIVGAIGE